MDKPWLAMAGSSLTFRLIEFWVTGLNIKLISIKVNLALYMLNEVKILLYLIYYSLNQVFF